MRTTRVPTPLLFLVVFVPCCLPATPPLNVLGEGDAGRTDGGPDDAGFSDAGLIDGGSDAGLVDAGLVDAGLTDAGLTDAGPDAGIACGSGSASAFPTFDRACNSDSDCTFGMHETDCCGSMTALGIATSAVALFGTDEALCEAMYPGCGCASDSVETDTGASVPPGDGPSAVVVHCTSNICTTSVRPSVSCDQATCTATQVCVQECSGVMLPDAGPLPSVCVDVPGACAASTSCSCYGPTDPCPNGSCWNVVNGTPTCLCE